MVSFVNYEKSALDLEYYNEIKILNTKTSDKKISSSM